MLVAPIAEETSSAALNLTVTEATVDEVTVYSQPPEQTQLKAREGSDIRIDMKEWLLHHYGGRHQFTNYNKVIY